MNIKLMIVTIFLSLLSLTTQADNYDNARKLQQASKEVADYQMAQMNGTYVNYSETPSWVKVFWGVVGFAVFGVIVIGISVGRSSNKRDAENVERPVAKFSGAAGSVTFEQLGDQIKQLTIVDIAFATGETDRAIKTRLIRHGLDSADFIGSESLRKLKKNGF